MTAKMTLSKSITLTIRHIDKTDHTKWWFDKSKDTFFLEMTR
jgi:hypothetical protein